MTISHSAISWDGLILREKFSTFGEPRLAAKIWLLPCLAIWCQLHEWKNLGPQPSNTQNPVVPKNCSVVYFRLIVRESLYRFHKWSHIHTCTYTYTYTQASMLLRLKGQLCAYVAQCWPCSPAWRQRRCDWLHSWHNWDCTVSCWHLGSTMSPSCHTHGTWHTR